MAPCRRRPAPARPLPHAPSRPKGRGRSSCMALPARGPRIPPPRPGTWHTSGRGACRSASRMPLPPQRLAARPPCRRGQGSRLPGKLAGACDAQGGPSRILHPARLPGAAQPRRVSMQVRRDRGPHAERPAAAHPPLPSGRITPPPPHALPPPSLSSPQACGGLRRPRLGHVAEPQYVPASAAAAAAAATLRIVEYRLGPPTKDIVVVGRATHAVLAI